MCGRLIAEERAMFQLHLSNFGGALGENVKKPCLTPNNYGVVPLCWKLSNQNDAFHFPLAIWLAHFAGRGVFVGKRIANMTQVARILHFVIN